MARVVGIVTVFLAVFLPIATQGLRAQSTGTGAPAPDAVASAPSQMCLVGGRVTSGQLPLPGVTVTIRLDGAEPRVTSTGVDGRFAIPLATGGVGVLQVALTGFSATERPFDARTACPAQVDVQLVVAPRVSATPGAPTLAGAPPNRGARGAGARTGSTPPSGRGAFETLTVQRQNIGETAAEATDPDATIQAQLSLPPGFSTDGPTDAVAVNGNQASVDRGQLGDRFDAFARGEFGAPPTDVTGAFGPPAGVGAGGGQGPAPGAGGRGAPGGGPGGRGLFLAGRGVQQRPYNFTTGYTFGGSALDSVPYQLRPQASNATPAYTRQNVDLSVGGPIKIPGLYDGTRKTTFTLNYSGNRGATLFDQYATVPSGAMRAGDFSSLSQAIVDPRTGQPFVGNQLGTIDASAASLLRYVPLPNLPGDARNYRFITTTDTTAESLNLRVVQNFTPNVAGRGGRGGGGAAGGGRGGGAGRGVQTGTSAVLNAQLQYRRGGDERNNVFPTLGGESTTSSLSVPATLNIARARTLHSVSLNLSTSSATTTNQYAFVENVAGNAGIAGASQDGFAWGVPALSFASVSSVSDLTPSRRDDSRVSIAYNWSKPVGRQTIRVGGDFRRDVSTSRVDANARGTFVFTGLYSGNDFADFLLGLPQQASLSYGPGNVELRGRALSLFAQDDWRLGSVTINAGLRYELQWPLVEAGGQLVNLDVSPDFSAAVPVSAGGIGPYSGQLPDALVRTDVNNLAPRVGVAWRAAQGTVVRGGYGVSFNSGSYATLARQMASQPPFAVTNTSLGTSTDPLAIATALALSSASVTTNTFGVDPDYQLGRVQTWNIDLSRDLSRLWTAGAGYTYARGGSLDLVRAPNRGPDGLRIEGVQPFLWQTSQAASRLNSATFRLRRRAANGVGGGVDYTLSRSRDNAANTGGGATIVAQDDQNLDAEWGLSSFNRLHQLSTNVNVSLPFGANRRWLSNGGFWGHALAGWTAAATFTAQSGTPLTARVLSSASDVARGVNGTLRADDTGAEVSLANPTIDRYFNTAAFALPAANAFGTAGRNTIIGPGSRDLGAQFSRDIQLSGTRTLSVQLRASNLLNLVNYASVDTVVNSPSFGQVTSVRPMRSMQLVLRFRY